MRPGERLPLLTEVLDLAQPGEAASPLPPSQGQPLPAASAPRAGAGPAVSEQMARAVLELELEQALREVLEPRLAALLRETAAELAQRLQARMHEWLDEQDAGG